MLNSWIISLGRSPLLWPVSILIGIAKLKYSSPFGKVCSELINILGGSVVWKIRSLTRSYSTLVLERLGLKCVLLFERWLRCPFIVRLLEALASIVRTESAWIVICRTTEGAMDCPSKGHQERSPTAESPLTLHSTKQKYNTELTTASMHLCLTHVARHLKSDHHLSIILP